MRSAGNDQVFATDRMESVEEAMMRLNAEIDLALEADDLAGVARARREMRKVQLEKPSAACRLLILEDCRAANALIRLGDFAEVEARVKAVRKLGRWLRWRRTAAKNLVPVATALEGILWALRSEPEVAWTAQCSLFHAARCADGASQSVREGTRGTISRLLLNEPSPFPLCLPELTPRAAEAYERALRTKVVPDFFSQLQSLTLMDPGYGDDPYCQEVQMFSGFARLLGRSFDNLRSLKILGFEDCAMKLFLPKLVLPKLQSLQVTGACQSAEAQQAILALLHRHGGGLAELELNVWTEFFCEADDPLVDVVVMPQVRRLKVRAPLAVPWERLAGDFPALEELTFLYDQDFAVNSMEVLDDRYDLSEGNWQSLESHAVGLYRDAVSFARDLHARGFLWLAIHCPKLREIRLAMTDTSFGYDITLTEDRLSLCWRRAPSGATSGPFRRDGAINNATRATLEAQGRFDGEESSLEDWKDGHMRVTEEQAAAMGSAVMLHVARFFDDPSLEVQFGLTS